jgi:hypothetical protein
MAATPAGRAQCDFLRSRRHIYIPSTREALTCWGYMQAMRDLSVLADEMGTGLGALVRRSRRRRYSSFDRSSAMRTRIAGNFRAML